MSQILSNLLVDLSEFTGETMTQIQAKMDASREESAQRWLSLGATNFTMANEFYETNEFSAYQSTAWMLRDAPMREIILSTPESAKRLGWQSVFDYGAGIGTTSLVLAELSDKKLARSIRMGDFNCPALSFAEWKAHKYKLPVKCTHFCACEEVPAIEDFYDCVLSIHVIGHCLNPFRTLAEIATHGKYSVWISDFRVCEIEKEDIYPTHRRKPSGWDIIWPRVYESVGSHVQRSKVYMQDANVLALEWIEESNDTRIWSAR